MITRIRKNAPLYTIFRKAEDSTYEGLKHLIEAHTKHDDQEAEFYTQAALYCLKEAQEIAERAIKKIQQEKKKNADPA